MDADIRTLAEQILLEGEQGLTDRERRVLARIAKRRAISRNATQAYEEGQTLGERLADKVAAVGGSWGFVIGFGLFLLAWAGLNSALLAGWRLAWDPYPYIFLNLLLSMLAAVQAPIIMMSQNRQAAKDRLQAAHDYEVNLKAELEIMALHEKLDRLRDENLSHLLRRQEEQLALLQAMVAMRDGGER